MEKAHEQINESGEEAKETAGGFSANSRGMVTGGEAEDHRKRKENDENWYREQQ